MKVKNGKTMDKDNKDKEEPLVDLSLATIEDLNKELAKRFETIVIIGFAKKGMSKHDEDKTGSFILFTQADDNDADLKKEALYLLTLAKQIVLDDKIEDLNLVDEQEEQDLEDFKSEGEKYDD